MPLEKFVRVEGSTEDQEVNLTKVLESFFIANGIGNSYAKALHVQETMVHNGYYICTKEEQ